MCNIRLSMVIYLYFLVHMAFFAYYYMEAFWWLRDDKSTKEKAKLLVRWLKWPIWLVYETIRDGYKTE